MKAIAILIFGFIFFSSVSYAEEMAISPLAKKLIFKAIAEHVYLEEQGLARVPQKASDFEYTVTAPETIVVAGKSFSPLDNKKIQYHCEIEVLGRGTIESEYDFEITYCDLKI